MRRFVVLFALLALGAYVLTMLPVVRDNISAYLNVTVSQMAGFLMMFTGTEVSVVGEFIIVPGFRVRIVDMCNGLEPTLLLWAALLAYPTTWTHKIKGMLLGFGVILFVNLIRICSLLILSTYSRHWFDWAHWYLFDTLMAITIVLVFLIWSSMAGARPHSEHKEA